MQELHQIRESVRERVEAIASAHGDWPCCKGCDDCCRSLASAPRISREEWLLIASAIEAMPAQVRERIRASKGQSRPVVCPLLDRESGTCMVYAVRPVACRAYGFYADRREVLGCGRIESLAENSADVVWGNHAALEDRLRVLGETRELAEWLE